MAKKVITWIVVPLMLLIFVLDIWVLVLCNLYEATYTITEEAFDGQAGDDRIHFLNTGCSDCILLESNGRFALVDAGEGNHNPRKYVSYAGYEEQVLAYLRKVCADAAGRISLDFILLTHDHYDHNGNAEAILRTESIHVDTVYMKEMTPGVLHGYEVNTWRIPETVAAIEAAIRERGFTRVSELPTHFTFGDFSVELFNTVTPAEAMQGEGGNAESVGVKLTKAGYIAFLAADISSSTGLEQLLGDAIGKVNLLKIGHHGYFGSNSASFLKKLSPDVAIVTNTLGKIYPNVKWNLTVSVGAPIYATVNRNGLIATVTDDGQLHLTENVH